MKALGSRRFVAPKTPKSRTEVPENRHCGIVNPATSTRAGYQILTNRNRLIEPSTSLTYTNIHTPANTEGKI